MDKETLSNYGWIVILVLILSVMLALATPFGHFIADGFKSAYNGFADVVCDIFDIERKNDSSKEGYAVFDNGDGTTTTLTWDELMLAENGEKYDYDASVISDTIVGEDAFEDNETLLSIVFPDTIETIGEYAFYDCVCLTNINLSGCSSLTTIGESAFEDCESLTTADLSGCTSLALIGENAFCNCKSITSIDLSECSVLTSIGKSSFESCYGLISVNFPQNLEIIESNAFCECISLIEVNLKECTKLTTIEDNAFECCSSLLKANLPNSITTIKEDAFSECYSLIGLYYNGTIEQWCNIDLGYNAIECGDDDINVIVCLDGVPCLEHEGGTATCQEKAQCVICGCRYGGFGSHITYNGYCKYCGVEANIETSHNPYHNSQDNVVLGTWDYSDAKSVTITITYQTESTYYDWIYLKSGNNYIDLNGNVTSTETKIGGTTKTTKTFTTTALTGSVIFRTDNMVNNYYGVQVIVTPNY